EAVALATGRRIVSRGGLRSQVVSLLERWYGSDRSAFRDFSDVAGESDAGNPDDIDHLRDLASGAPVVRLVNLVIQRAVDLRASDVHIEPLERGLKVRYRIDGVLEEGEPPPANLAAAITSRVKIMARLDIAERRLPQDGRIMLRVQGKALDLRVSTIPTAHGEGVVIRLLDRDTLDFDLEGLGFPDD